MVGDKDREHGCVLPITLVQENLHPAIFTTTFSLAYCIKMMSLFIKKAPVPEVKKAWPSELNPCPKHGAGVHNVSPLWDVQGKVTKVCVGCIGELEKALETRGITEARLSALWWFFTPNPHGADVKYGVPFSEKPLLGDRPSWATEEFKQSVLSPFIHTT